MIDNLPVVNACLNGTAFVFLLLGLRAVKAKRIADHKRWMLSAVGASAVFLVFYVTYHVVHGHTKFAYQGWPRRIYFTILATHVPLAAIMVAPILRMLYLAFHGRIDEHKRIARWVLPIWLYVSVTGVAVYVMLYQLYPSR